MWFLFVLVVSWIAYGVAAYHVGKSAGHNELVADLKEPLDTLYTEAYEAGYTTGYDDGSRGLEEAVEALRAWGKECQSD